MRVISRDILCKYKFRYAIWVWNISNTIYDKHISNWKQYPKQPNIITYSEQIMGVKRPLSPQIYLFTPCRLLKIFVITVISAALFEYTFAANITLAQIKTCMYHISCMFCTYKAFSDSNFTFLWLKFLGTECNACTLNNLIHIINS